MFPKQGSGGKHTWQEGQVLSEYVTINERLEFQMTCSEGVELVGTIVECSCLKDTCVDAIVFFEGTAESIRSVGIIHGLSDEINSMLATLAK
jgi:hypothetical protein